MKNKLGLVLALAALDATPPSYRHGREINIPLDDACIGPTGIEWKPGRGPKPAVNTKRHAGDAKKAKRKNQQAGRRANRK